MTNEELKAYRIKLIRDASMMQEKPDRIPHVSFCVTWKILDAGYKLSEAMSDFDIMEKVVRYHQEQYGFDAIYELGERNSVSIPASLGRVSYVIDDEAGTVNYTDQYTCGRDDLDELIADPIKFTYEKGMARKYPCWADKTVTLDMIQNAVNEQMKFDQYSTRIRKVLSDEYGVPEFIPSTGMVYPGVETLFNALTGIRELSVMMRKEPDKLEEAIAALDEMYVKPSLELIKSLPEGPDMNYCYDFDMTILSHTIMSVEQFERFLWPDLKKVLDLIAEKKKTIRILTEGSAKRFWSYFKDYPKGMITIHDEQDDIFELHKELPNVAIMGGMPVSLLGSGTPQECVDYAKKLCDELGSDGGFILCQDKMVSYKNDATSENLKAVCDFVREYRV